MSTFQWRTASDLRLIARIVPDPREPGERLDRLADVRVAVHGDVLYVEPGYVEPGGVEPELVEPGLSSADQVTEAAAADVYAIPVASVVFLAYR